MSLRYVGAQLGLLLLVLSGMIALVGLGSGIAWVAGDPAEATACRALLAAALAGSVAGYALWLLGRRAGEHLGRREALLIVASGWLIGAALAALPYAFWGELETDWQTHDPAFRLWTNCYFEAMSGLTTTGATVLARIESVPPSLLFWRALTHWLGGLGIVVLFVAVLPTLGVGGKRVFRVEAPGPAPEGVRPKIQETAQVLWMIYVGLSAVEILALRLLGLSWFDSVCHTFATLATGGFSTRNGSVGELDSLGIDVVVILFMVLAGVNFGIYYNLIRGRWRVACRDPELRAYFLVLAIGSICVMSSILGGQVVLTTAGTVEPTLGSALRHGVFQAVSMQTTTGFCTSDFNQWPALARIALVALMFVGASAGSTGGGIKIVRWLIAAKVLWAELERIFRPNVVRVVKIGTTPIDADLRLATLSFFLIVLFLFTAGSAALLLLEEESGIDLTTAVSAAAATLNNIGPGLGRVGAVETYAWFGAPSKVVMSLLMALGRLEVFAIAVLFVPRFWVRE